MNQIFSVKVTADRIETNSEGTKIAVLECSDDVMVNVKCDDIPIEINESGIYLFQVSCEDVYNADSERLKSGIIVEASRLETEENIIKRENKSRLSALFNRSDKNK